MDSDESTATLWKPNILVIGPGGMKGFKYLGALWAIESAGLISEITTLVGVSVGAIIGMLWLAGYKIPEIFRIAANSGIFHGINSIDIKQVITGFGAISNDNIKDMLSEKMTDKYGFVPTLQHFYMLTGIKYEVVVTNLDKVEANYINYETDPDMSVVDVSMMTMNIPFIYRVIHHRGCSVIDGAFSNPYPVDRYDHGDNKILGMALETEFNDDPSANIVAYTYRIMNHPITMLRRMIKKNCSDRCKHIMLYSSVADITGMSIDLESKKRMLTTGWSNASIFIRRLRAGIQSIEIPEDGEIPVVTEDEVLVELDNVDSITQTCLTLEDSDPEDPDKYIYINLSDRTSKRLGFLDN